MAGSASSLGSAIRQIGRLFDGGTVAGLDDAQLLERFVDRRDEIAFAAIVERHGPMVLGVCRAILKNAAEVEDAFQATFLVLIRKAGSIRGQGALGGWLHRVAYRIAVQAGVEVDRRRMLERKAGEFAARKTEIAGFPDDLCAILHEEIDRLPERSRLPLVLCDLDGLDHAEASRRLGWTEGEFRGRLYRARAKLRDRLTRRGLGLSLVVLTEALAKESTAAVPRVWINALTKAAVAMPAGKIVATGAISATAAKLAQTTLATLFAESAKGVAAVGTILVVLGLVGVHTVPVGFAQAGNDGEMKREMPAPKQAAPSIKPITAKSEDRTKPLTFAGVVLDPDGKPFAGAKISLVSYGLKNPSDRSTRAASGADGRFRFDVPIAEFDANFEPGTAWQYATLVARAEGFAFGMASLGRKVDTLFIAEGKVPTIRLSRDDVPIEGRIIGLEGKPVAGVEIGVRTVQASEDENLTEWLAGLKELGGVYTSDSKFLSRNLVTPIGPPVAPARSDIDGRFRITGIGRERVVELHIEGPSIETVHVRVRTRPGETLRLPAYKNFREEEPIIIYGSSFTHIAGPARTVEGTVTDRDTGQPLAGIMIHGERSLGNPMEYISAITDAQGHYRLTGRASRQGKDILALSPSDFPYGQARKAAFHLPPDESLPYLRAQLKVPNSPGTAPIKLDIGLKHGVYVTGRVLDKGTGRPARATVEYFVYLGNPFMQQAPGFGRAMTHGESTDAEGTFHIVALPGPGVITARSWKSDDYRFGIGLEGSKRVDKSGFLNCYPHNPIPTNYHTLAEIDPTEGTRTLTRDLLLDPGRSLTLNVIGPDGKPLAGASIAGLKDMGYWVRDLPPDATSYSVVALKPGKERRIIARHDGKRLIGELILKGDEAGPVTIKLGPWGEIVGRVVEADGQPWSKATRIDANVSAGESPRPGKDGRFRINGLIPGRAYRFRLIDEQKSMLLGEIIHDVSVKPGEVKDLGDIVVKPEKPQ